jgi:Zn-finger nucleic acid-binding protein
MDCPKCNGEMREHSTTTLQGAVTIDKCTECGGIWFDKGEAEILKGDWMSDFLDSGDPLKGKELNQHTDINCPRCGIQMETVNDPEQQHILYEMCNEHGMFMDAGEFADYKNETLVETLFKFIGKARGKLSL